jgi:hypothetical protein
MDLSGAHLMDGQHVLSQEHLNIANDIAHRYDNLRLIWIPPADRLPGTDDKPFGVLDIQTQFIVKRFPEQYVPIIPRWLYENDSQRTDTFASFEKEQAKIKADKEKAIEEKHQPILDLNHSILKSNLHTYKHDGIRYGDSGIERIN